MSSMYPFRVVRPGTEDAPSTIVGIQRTQREAEAMSDKRTRATSVEHYVLDSCGRRTYTSGLVTA